MKTNYFELYESKRKKYKPGTVWTTKGKTSITTLEILSKVNPHDRYPCDYSSVIIGVLETKGYLYVGAEKEWSTSYLEENYVPMSV
jgi:hypothetical protein